MPAEVQTVPTALLPPGGRAALRDLLTTVFDDLADTDVEHALGGLHVVVWEGTVMVAHAAVVQRRIVHRGRALRAGYLEAVAVHPTRRGEGLGRAVVAAATGLVAAAYELGALGATDEAKPLYRSLGWREWQGGLAALTPDGVVPTPGARGSVFVLPVAGVPLDPDADLVADWRDGDVW